jgi:Phosphoribosylformylglycinamidine (FGAM) synthase
MTARVYVTLKKAVLDPQGKAVERSRGPFDLGHGACRSRHWWHQSPLSF